MSVYYGGKPCLDPAQEASNCRDLGYALGPWVSDANGFTCPLGCAPGRGRVLMRRADLDALNREASYDLVFRETVNVVTVKDLLVVRAVAITPGYRSDPQAAYWVELADKRYLCQGVPIDQAFNVRSAPGGDYFSATLNASVAWTWTGMVSTIWTAVGKLGTYPGLPFTPDGTPEGWSFYGGRALEALGQVLDRIGCALCLNPLTGVYTIVRIGATDTAADLALAARENGRVGDDDSLDPQRARIPASVRVRFPKQRANADSTGASPWYNVDVAGTYTAAETGTYAVVQDDLPAIYDDTDTLTNSAALATRAAERAADYYRRVALTRLRREFSGAQSAAGLLPGSQVKSIAWRERGGLGLTTEVVRNPGLPVPEVPYGPGGAAPMTEDESVLETFNEWNISQTLVENTYVGGDTLSETNITSVWMQIINLIASYSWTFSNPIRQCSWLYWCSANITLSTFSTNNLSLASTKKIVYRLDTSADADLTGIVAGASGQVLLLTNVSAYTISLRNESASSSAANRFQLPDAADIDLSPDAVALLWYDVTDLRWKVLAAPGLTVAESDGTPSYDRITSLEFDQADGFSLSQPGAGRVKVNYGVTVKESDGSPSYSPVQSIEFDQAAGFVVTQPASGRAKISYSASSSGITVKESDGSPSYSSITSLEFDSASGLVVSQPAAGRATVTGGITVKESDGSPSYSPVITLEFQQPSGSPGYPGFVVTQPGTGRATITVDTGGPILGTGLVDGAAITGQPATGGSTINLSDTGVTAGTYTFGTKSVTVDAQGRITNIV